MTTETICWNCNKPYPINDPQCPHCKATNGNINPDKAYEEALGWGDVAEDFGDLDGTEP